MTTTPIVPEGNLASDPETATAESGVEYTRFLVAVDTRRPDGAGGFVDGEPEFHRVTAFGTLGRNSGAQLHSGDRVVVAGELQFRTWTDAETQKRRQNVEIIAQSIGASTRFADTVSVNRPERRVPAPEPASTGPVAWPTAQPGSAPSLQ